MQSLPWDDRAVVTTNKQGRGTVEDRASCFECCCVCAPRWLLEALRCALLNMPKLLCLLSCRLKTVLFDFSGFMQVLGCEVKDAGLFGSGQNNFDNVHRDFFSLKTNERNRKKHITCGKT